MLMSHRRNSGRQKDEFLVRCDFDDKIGRQGNNQDNSDKHFKLTPEVSQTYVEEKIKMSLNPTKTCPKPFNKKPGCIKCENVLSRVIWT